MNGFQAPNYTQIPNDYFDLIVEMTIAEIKVLSTLLRVTLGYHRDEITLTIRELARITHLDPKSVMAGASKLEERGLIKRTVGNITTISKWTVVIGDPKLWEKIIKTVGNDSYKNEPLPYNKKKKRKEKEAPKAKYTTPDEVKIFREVTERYPNKINFADVALIIQGVSKRLGRECSADDLRPFYAAWCAKGFKPVNLAWLSWAEQGVIPEIRPVQKSTNFENNMSILKSFMAKGE